MTSRRAFLSLLPMLLVPRLARALPGARFIGFDADPRPKHPEPRPGITAAKVLPATALHSPDAIAAFDMARQVPEVLDGIRCSCGCADLKGYYSLLSCFEDGGMAQHSVICQGEARLAFKLHKDGWSLNGIRRSIDAAFSD